MSSGVTSLQVVIQHRVGSFLHTRLIVCNENRMRGVFLTLQNFLLTTEVNRADESWERETERRTLCE